MCKVLNISRQNYYKYRNAEDKDYKDYLIIKEVFDESKKTYGYRRIKKAILLKYGWIVNKKKVLRIMKKYDLKAAYLKRLKINKCRKVYRENIEPNLLNRKFKVHSPNKIWVTDITYLQLNNKVAYLSTILDLSTPEVVSYKISRKNDLNLVMQTLNEAIEKIGNIDGLIIHSDQGSQYTSIEYKKVCISNGITISMSRRGTPLDNASIESFHSLLKKETIYNNYIPTLEKYIDIVHDWIKFYNSDRIKQ